MTRTTTATLVTDEIAWADRLEALAADNRLRAGSWGDGHATACFLSAIGPGVKDDADVPCPSMHMPLWMAPLTRTLFDGWAEPAAMAALAAPVMRRWSVLDDDAWGRVRLGFLKHLVTSALEAAAKACPTPRPAWFDQVQNACDQVLAALDADDAARAADAYKVQAEVLFDLISAEVEATEGIAP